MALTEKQRRFVEAFMGSAKGNATQAARLAGYNGGDETLRNVGSRNLTKPHIQEAIGARVDADEDGLIATREDRQRWWSEVMRDSTVDMKHRLRASELLGKTQADFVERQEVTHSGAAQVQVYIPSNGRERGEEES